MSVRCIKVLHVEDDRLPQEIVADHLATIEGLQCEVIVATSEEQAVERFVGGGFELVLLDYQLVTGNGLSCLRRIRRRDQIVPVIALSGKYDPSIAAELLQNGADLFIRKDELSAVVLSDAVRTALQRADFWRSAARARYASQASGDGFCYCEN